MNVRLMRVFAALGTLAAFTSPVSAAINFGNNVDPSLTTLPSPQVLVARPVFLRSGILRGGKVEQPPVIQRRLFGVYSIRPATGRPGQLATPRQVQAMLRIPAMETVVARSLHTTRVW